MIKEQWLVDIGRMIDMKYQAEQLIDNEGTERGWIAIGIPDEDGIAEIVALSHPTNAKLIAAAPDLLEAAQYLLKHIKPSKNIKKDFCHNLALANLSKAVHQAEA